VSTDRYRARQRTPRRLGVPAVTWFDTELRTELALASDFRSFVEGLAASEMFNDDAPTS
jgi:hypothetical protein